MAAAILGACLGLAGCNGGGLSDTQVQVCRLAHQDGVPGPSYCRNWKP